MRRTDHADLRFPPGERATHLGRPFTGLSVTTGTHETSAQTFVEGVQKGPELSWHENGQLIALGNTHADGLPVGPLHYWDTEGNLAYEHVNDASGSPRITREWDESGNLVGEERHEDHGDGTDTGDEAFPPWQWIRLAPGMRAPDRGGFLPAVSVRDLTTAEVEGRGRRALYGGTPYTGEAVTLDRRGRVEMRTFVGGVEDGPTLTWASSGKLVVQGITQRPHGPVGPWHQWDERGRLLREVVHDALGNRIIVRELDGAGNIAREERRPPARLVRDPETGREHPAPWL
ncbi:toxin-antitoxin system YwqK family antitoxin [Nocardiopsis deserti]|uniref:toxin-antitoxin system YwqK family antitoxin n=1 Tax=Nocardiopsis deserti TaxID=2605988 RepID=UPI001CC2682F|nr:hypothetical protein [Nocardiopsis deserti]